MHLSPTLFFQKAIVLIALVGLAPAALAQIDTEKRTYLEGGASFPLLGSGPIVGYSFLLWNRPHIHGQDTYARIILTPLYARGEWLQDNWPGRKQAIGLGIEGGLFSNNFYDYSSGRFRTGQSFWGHNLKASFAYYIHPTKIMGKIPVDVSLTVSPGFFVYQRRGDTEEGFQIPDNTPETQLVAGLRIGGVPPMLVSRTAVEFSIWHLATYRFNAGEYGLPAQPEHTRHATDRTWLRLGATIPVSERQTASLFFDMGIAGRTDPLSVYRMGGLQRLHNPFPLALHGYGSDEIFAEGYRLVNAYYRFPLLPKGDTLQLKLNFDYANVDYLSGHEEPRRDLVGLGTDLIAKITPSTTLMFQYGYGVDSYRGDGFGRSTVGLRFETQL